MQKEKKKTKNKIFNLLNYINYEKKPWKELTNEEKKSWSTFLINRWLSMDINLIYYINEFQQITMFKEMTPELTYKFYCDFLTRKKRFNKYVGGRKALNYKYNTKLKEIIAKYYEISQQEASDYLEILMKNKEDLKNIIMSFGVSEKDCEKLIKNKKND